LSPGIEVPKADEITIEPDLLAAAQFITRKRQVWVEKVLKEECIRTNASADENDPFI